jgi:hypothetical protein
MLPQPAASTATHTAATQAIVQRAQRTDDIIAASPLLRTRGSAALSSGGQEDAQVCCHE